MHIKKKVENRVICPTHPLNKKSSTVTTMVPDEEIERNDNNFILPPELKTATEKMLGKFKAIRNETLTPETKLPAWTKKHEERLKAYQLKKELRLARRWTN